jgi:predicted transposase YbfD/YdcC
MVERERQVGDETSSERSYFISSHELNAERAGAMVRGHWSIENGLHWVLDVVFHEDALPINRARIRDRRGAQNFARLRKLALMLLKNAHEQARQEHREQAQARRLGSRLPIPGVGCVTARPRRGVKAAGSRPAAPATALRLLDR